MPDALSKRLVDYLPAIYQEPAQPDEPPFLNGFLRAFENVLLGSTTDTDQVSKEPAGENGEREDEVQGLKEKIAELHRLFDPNRTPEEFLPWLASWTAFTLRADLSVPRRRQLIARMIPLYSIRGTRKYAEQVLKLHLEAMPVVTDFELPAFQVGSHSMVGDDTCLGGGPPHFFRVFLVAPLLNERELEGQRQMARSVLELAKPAHTHYELETASPHLEVGVRSRLGLDTVLSPAAV
jgi:phage tail-like protein